MKSTRGILMEIIYPMFSLENLQTNNGENIFISTWIITCVNSAPEKIGKYSSTKKCG
jgi:hypothetical protein